MVVVDIHRVLNTEPCIVSGELRGWRDATENGQDEFIREPENWDMERVRSTLDVLPEEPV